MSVPAKKIVEAILLLADAPVPSGVIGQVLEEAKGKVDSLLKDIAAGYESEGRGFCLRETGSGWRLYTHPDCAPWLERFVTGDRIGRLSGPALEVLAIVAYKGPISRAQIAEIRGVDSDGVVRTLMQKSLVTEDRRGAGAGPPALVGVSDEFLERIGLRSVDELPPLTGFMPDGETIEAMEARLSPGA